MISRTTQPMMKQSSSNLFHHHPSVAYTNGLQSMITSNRIITGACFHQSFLIFNTNEQDKKHPNRKPFFAGGLGKSGALSTPPKTSSSQVSNPPPPPSNSRAAYEKMREEREEQLEAEEFAKRREQIRDNFQKQFFENMDPNEFKKAWEQAQVDENAEYKKITFRQQMRWWIKDHDRFDRFMKLLMNPTATEDEKHYAKEQVDEMVKLYGEVRVRPSNRKKIPARLTLVILTIVMLLSWMAVKGQQRMVNKERQDQVLEDVVKRSQPTEEMRAVPQVNHREILQEIENQRLQKLRREQEKSNQN
ncbi:hypothetical protein C9374_005237 [Naegleria lovaniensis]|uniref:Uncharacterized protein n=1 Tax=Naegleria lovaniensis TaxID=51637 RepID=A0AA88GQV1_NAELO|nr:uncharacterized protein C9374_005237 [Naegleria lovaniensis]KAG2382657.1 hypothetical protein C9374_005237 [Naegleria lovaniensis]